MLCFHIDMHVAQFKRGYLERWLEEIAKAGYDTVIWELENYVRWESCPECASPDAISKDEFREILSFSRKLGLEPLPLLQTLGHCEYVLRLERFRHLAETPGCVSQYCPRKPEARAFLERWMEEYFELFGSLKFMHLGGDEARHLGECPECSAFAARNSKAELFVEHVNALAEAVARHGARPAIWADMPLRHPEALKLLSKDLVLFDWQYDLRGNDGKVFIWSKDLLCDKSSLPPSDRELFERFLFPLGDEPGREPEPFYSASFLRSEGFDVVTCPSSSSYGDNVFAPRHCHHSLNCFASLRAGSASQLQGSALTSWSQHLFPWELQLASIEIPRYLKQSSAPSFDEFQQWFERDIFGLDGFAFWKAAGLLSKQVLFCNVVTLGYAAEADIARGVAPGHFKGKLAEIKRKGELRDEIENCHRRLKEYEMSLSLFNDLKGRAAKGRELLELWSLAARNLVNRAKAVLCLLEHEAGAESFTHSPEAALEELRQLRSETAEVYSQMQRPARCKDIMEWLYGGLERELSGI